MSEKSEQEREQMSAMSASLRSSLGIGGPSSSQPPPNFSPVPYAPPPQQIAGYSPAPYMGMFPPQMPFPSGPVPLSRQPPPSGQHFIPPFHSPTPGMNFFPPNPSFPPQSFPSQPPTFSSPQPFPSMPPNLPPNFPPPSPQATPPSQVSQLRKSQTGMSFSPSNQKKKEDLSGYPVSFSDAVVDTGKIKSPRELPTNPITLYSSEYKYNLGSLIAVNKTYICYIVRGDMIRVLTKTSNGRELIRGHTAPIVDIQFFSQESDIFASAAMDGGVFVWKLAGTEEGTLRYDQLLAIKAEGTAIERILWSPIREDIFLTAESDGNIHIWNRASLTTNGLIERAQASSHLYGNTDLKDVCFAKDGKKIACSGKLVKIWDCTTGENLKELDPFPGYPTFTVLFCGPEDSLLITGGEFNTVFKIWNTRNWSCLQTLRCVPSEGFKNHIALDASNQFLFVANTTQKMGFLFHLNLPQVDESNPDVKQIKYDSAGFDYVTPFSVSQPILSFAVCPSDGVDIELYCVQTKAIQISKVDPSQFYSLQSQPQISDVVYNGSLPFVAPPPSPTTTPLKSSSPAPPPSSSPLLALKSPSPVPPPVAATAPPPPTTTPSALFLEPPTPDKPSEPAKDSFPHIDETVHKYMVEAKENKKERSHPSSSPSPSPSPSSSHLEKQQTPPETREEEEEESDQSSKPNKKNVLQLLESKISAPTAAPTERNPQESTSEGPAVVKEEVESKPKKNRKKGKNSDVEKKEVEKKEETSTPVKQVSILTRPKNQINFVGPTAAPAAATASPAAAEQAVAPESRAEKQQDKNKKTKKEANPSLPVNSEPDSSVESSPLLNKQLQKLEFDLSSRMERIFQSEVSKLHDLLEKERLEREKLERERQEKLLAAIAETLNKKMSQEMEKIIHKEISNIVVPTIGKLLVQAIEGTLLKPLQENFKNVISQSIGPKIESFLKESLTKKDLSKNLSTEISKTLSPQISKELGDQFVKSFSESVVPAFEKSTQEMFNQISTTFEKGLQHRTASSTDKNSEVLTEQLKMTVQTLLQVSTQMNKSIIDTQAKLLEQVSSGRSIERTEQQPQPASALSFTQELSNLVKEERYEEALSRALSARNVEIVVWLCSKMDPGILSSQKTKPPSQYVILSLLSQLPYDLPKDTLLKLTWLREAALVLDPHDKNIEQHAPAVLTQLLRVLEEHYPKYADSSNPSSSAFKMLMHIVNSLRK